MTAQPPTAAPATSLVGRMTVAMRAVTLPASSLRLRVALVLSGKIVDERLMQPGASVTLGAGERSTFVLSSASAPACARVFESSRGGFELLVIAGMGGRIALGTRVLDLAEVAPGTRLRLDERARGKVTLFGATILFQLTPAPPAASRPALPLSVRPSLADGIDKKTLFIAAFSFLFHFGAVGGLWSDWADAIVDDDVRTADLVQSLKQLPTPPPIEQPTHDDQTVAKDDGAKAETKSQAGASTTKSSPSAHGGEGARGDNGHGKPMSDASASAIVAQLRGLDVDMVGVLGGNGASVNAVLQDGNVPSSLLDDAGRSAMGSTRGSSAGLNMNADAGGIVRPGSHRGSDLPGNIHSDGPADVGRQAEVKKPVGGTVSATPQDPSGEISDAGAVVARAAGGFRACYRKGQAENPEMEGSFRVTARIGPNGEVSSASPSGVNGLSPTVVSCVTARVQSMQFSPPKSGGATLAIPFVFKAQK